MCGRAYAETDALTGLLSRRVFGTDLERLDDGEVAALIVVDIDDFKSVNDSFGHATGDDVACLPDHVRHPVELLAVADVAMYAAKNSGRNWVVEATQAA